MASCEHTHRAKTVRLAPDDSCAADVAVHLRAAAPSPSSPPLIVIAPVSWLSRVPYFATKLKEPWCQATPSSQQPHISLECTPGSYPVAYLRCLRLLDACSPRLFESVTEVLELLPVADHLLFQECWDACMKFLAATPWSGEEEDDIRAVVAMLNLKPSSDVCERLDTSQDVTSLEYMLRHMVSSASMEESLSALAQKLESSPTAVKKAFGSSMLKMRASYPVTESSLPPREWYVLTKLLLQLTDAHEVVLQLIDSQLLFTLIYSRMINRDKYSTYILNQVLQKVVSRVVPLSNSQRALLVTRLGAASARYKDTNFEAMRQTLAQTLPLGDPVRMNLVKASSELHSAWFDQLIHRINHWDSKASCDSTHT